MAVTKLIEGLPTRTMTQEVFDAAMAKLMADLPAWADEVNITAASVSAGAAGGAFAIPYTYKTSGGLFVAGNGHFATDSNANVTLAGQIYLDHTSAAAQSVAAQVATFALSSSVVKGHIRVSKVNDATKFLIFQIASATNLGAYTQVNGIVTQAFSATPFAVGDSLVAHFTRTGDKGDSGETHLKVSDRKASGTGGGASVAGLQVRTLNTVSMNSIVGASLATDTVSLPAGTYEVWARAPQLRGNAHQIQLWNTSDATLVIGGTSAYASGPGDSQTDSMLFHRFTIATAKNFQLKHYVQSAYASNGLGTNATPGASSYEVYAELHFTKIP